MNTGSRETKAARLLFLSPNETGGGNKGRVTEVRDRRNDGGKTEVKKRKKLSETLADLKTITTFASAIGKRKATLKRRES